jgi:hypothetical protein
MTALAEPGSLRLILLAFRRGSRSGHDSPSVGYSAAQPSGLLGPEPAPPRNALSMSSRVTAVAASAAAPSVAPSVRCR